MTILHLHKFCKTDDQGNVIDYPVDLYEVINATNINDVGWLINNPPRPYEAVFMDDSVLQVPELFKAEEITPVRNTDGKLVRQRQLVPFTTAETVEYLEMLRRTKRQEINEQRLRANSLYFNHAGKRIACDKVSKDDILGTDGEIVGTGQLPVGWPGGWKTMDNSYVPIASVAAWRAFYSSMYAQGQTNFLHAQALKALIDNAPDVASIKAVQWNTSTGLNATVIDE